MAASDWIRINIPCKEEQKEIVSAWLDHAGVEAVEEYNDGLIAYTTSGNYENLVQILASRTAIELSSLESEEMEDRNWNAEWEAGFKPVQVSGIFIRAPFHKPASPEFEDIILAPRMAFGTGHHETTFMMLAYLEDYDCRGLRVLDYGCGTGILSVYLARKNPGHITAIDIQTEAIENTIENFKLNGLSLEGHKFLEGTLDQVDNDNPFDLILANINRHVLEESVLKLRDLLAREGRLVCSGILQSDRNRILSHFADSGLVCIHEESKGDWLLLGFDKTL